MAYRFAWALSFSLGLVACGSDDKPTTQQPADTGGETTDVDEALAIACTDPEAAVYGDPGALPADKGAIIKCSKGDRIDRAGLEAKAKANGYQGKPFTSGAKIYRILYRTERGGPSKLPGYSSAIVYLPDTPRAAKSPLMLVGHGSRGHAPACAPSRFTAEGEYVRSDFEGMVLPLVGAGLPVIAPDWAGYANHNAPNNPPPTYANAEDVGKSMLDATRAFGKLAPSVIDDQVVLVGHSQGGHAVLATLALSASYGLAGKIAATVAFAPLWLSQRSWGALMFLPDDFNFEKYRAANAVSIFYHYTTGELLDGPGKGLDMFQESKRPLVKKFVDEQCWAATYPLMDMMGTKSTDVFTPEFASAVGAAAGAGADCPAEEPSKSVCETWIARYTNDRPHLTGDAAKVPILFLYGNKDTTIPPVRAACARDRLNSDKANVSYCIEPETDHGGIVKIRTSHAIDWLLARTGNGAEPAACPKSAGADIGAECDPIPPND